jgi:hypothetical protein
MNGFTGRGRSGSRNLSMMAPRTVRKKKAYSASPLRVNRMRMFPSRMYTADRIVLSMRALLAAISGGQSHHAWYTYIGDSPLSIAVSAASLESATLVTFRVPTRPTVPRSCGNQLLFDAATVILPATKLLPRAEPAITRHMSAVAK